MFRFCGLRDHTSEMAVWVHGKVGWLTSIYFAETIFNWQSKNWVTVKSITDETLIDGLCMWRKSNSRRDVTWLGTCKGVGAGNLEIAAGTRVSEQVLQARERAWFLRTSLRSQRVEHEWVTLTSLLFTLNFFNPLFSLQHWTSPRLPVNLIHLHPIWIIKLGFT